LKNANTGGYFQAPVDADAIVRIGPAHYDTAPLIGSCNR
jgi:hypothetical protein